MMKASDMQIEKNLDEFFNKVFSDLVHMVKLKSIKYEEAQVKEAESFKRFVELCTEFRLSNNKKMYADSKNIIIKETFKNWFTRTDQDRDVIDMYRILLNKINEEKQEARSKKNKEQIEIIQFISKKAVDSYTIFAKTISHEDRITEMLKTELNQKEQQVQDIVIKNNDNKGANAGYIATVKTETGRKENYYVKTFSNDIVFNSKGSINPNELLIYKIMQYTNFGPEALFLIKGGSSSGGSGSIHAGNYIATRDLADANHTFLLDTPENEELISLWATRQAKQFAIEIESAAAMRDILSLYDTFNKNVKNYGLLVSNNDESIKIQFIDHLPNANNGILSKLLSKSPEEIKKYSPRFHLNEEYIAIHKNDPSFNKSPIIDYAIKTREEYSKDAIREEVKTRLLLSNIIDLIQQAKEDVKTLIEAHEENFTPDALSNLDSYVEKINKNVTTFCVSMDYTDLDHNIPNVYAFHDQEETSFIPSLQEEMKEYESKFIGEAQDH